MFKENLANNTIIGEIKINDSSSKRIINIEEIDKKMNEYCEIYINNIKIKFNEFYCFPKNGVYSIKYKFNKLLDSTRGMFKDCD